MNRSSKIIIAAFAVVLLVVLVLGYFVPDMLTETVPENQPTASVSQQAQPSAAVPTRTPKEETPEEEATPEDEPKAEAPVEETEEVSPTLRFRNSKLLNQHYEKHGKDMGFASAEEYEKAAAAVPENPNVLHKTEKEDGDDVYYVEATNEFVIVSTDGYIRTYFKPDSGIKYFNKQ